MAQVIRTNPRFREKHTIAEEMAAVLNSSLSYGTQHAMVHQVTWVWTEFYGKHTGCPYWSRAARQLLSSRARQIGSLTIHEHLVPRNIVLDHVFSLRGHATPLAIYSILERLLIGVVVTREEDKALNDVGLNQTMPAAFFEPAHRDFDDPWCRYRHPDAYIHVDHYPPTDQLPAPLPSWLAEWTPPPTRHRSTAADCGCVTCSR